ncbi:hypothetical protein [Pseudobythopirellula maris]|nr:hypothetical protein [Pseudobythopirellula maris]
MSFRQQALLTVGDVQLAAYYDDQGRVTVARRKGAAGDWRVSSRPS